MAALGYTLACAGPTLSHMLIMLAAWQNTIPPESLLKVRWHDWKIMAFITKRRSLKNDGGERLSRTTAQYVKPQHAPTANKINIWQKRRGTLQKNLNREVKLICLQCRILNKKALLDCSFRKRLLTLRLHGDNSYKLQLQASWLTEISLLLLIYLDK